MSTLAICDTEPIAIEGLRCLLDANCGPTMVARETAIEAGVEAVRDLSPTLLIVDRAFGAHNVMEWLRSLRAGQAHTAVMVWGSAISEPEALRYVQSGAGGVIRKTAPLNDILTCVRTVMNGGTWMEYCLLPDLALVARTGRSSMTAREVQVIDLVERGMKNREIAHVLGIQTGTVKIHLKHIFEKTGIRGRHGLTLSGLREQSLGALVS